MSSNTQITKRRRRRKRVSVGKANRKERRKAATPKFPIQPEK